jgi:GNAT superfamily N-acetyltransferase
MNDPSILVRRATPEDRTAIFDFIRQAYAGRWQYKIPERWQWAYLENPYLEPGELPLWIAVDGQGAVVGQTGALVEPLVVAGQAFRAGWSIDTFLLPEHRGRGLGRALQQANDEANPIFISLSMSEANRRIKTSLGSTALQPVLTFVKVVRHEPDRALETLLDRLYLRGDRPRDLVAAPLRALKLDRTLARTLTARTASRDYHEFSRIDRSVQIESTSEITLEFDRLWETVSPRYPALIRRDRNYLKWKYDGQPHTDYQRLIARRNGEICGYLILRLGRPPEPNHGILTDLFTAPDDSRTIHALAASGVARLQSQGAESILAATNLPAYQGILQSFGFRPTKPSTPMVHCRVEAAACKTLLAPGALLLGKGDHDWDQFPLG